MKGKATNTDPRRAKTRETLMRAGVTLFGNNSSDAISIDDILRVSGVSKQTFYNHFNDKGELIKAILRSVRSVYESCCFRVNEAETDPARRVARALCVYGRLALDDRESGHFVARMLLDDLTIESDTNRGVVSDVASGLAQGRLAVPVIETGVSFIFGVTQALVARILTCPDTATAVAVSQQFAMLLLRALGIAQLEAEVIAAQAADQIVRLGVNPG